MEQPAFRYLETAQMLNELHARDGHLADASPLISPSDWHTKYLHLLTGEVAAQIYVDETGAITREMLRGLAERSREEPADDRRLSDLFWNILAWGISGDWRRVGPISKDFGAQPDNVLARLRKARDASYAGRIGEAYDAVAHVLSHWGPAFMTKFLAFTSNPVEDGQPKAITVDSRVQLAWQILIGPEGAKELTATRYQRLCEQAATLAADNNWTVDEFEQRMFLFGRQVGSYVNWAEAELGCLRGATPTTPAPEIVQRLGN